MGGRGGRRRNDRVAMTTKRKHHHPHEPESYIQSPSTPPPPPPRARPCQAAADGNQESVPAPGPVRGKKTHLHYSTATEPPLSTLCGRRPRSGAHGSLQTPAIHFSPPKPPRGHCAGERGEHGRRSRCLPRLPWCKKRKRECERNFPIPSCFFFCFFVNSLVKFRSEEQQCEHSGGCVLTCLFVCGALSQRFFV